MDRTLVCCAPVGLADGLPFTSGACELTLKQIANDVRRFSGAETGMLPSTLLPRGRQTGRIWHHIVYCTKENPRRVDRPSGGICIKNLGCPVEFIPCDVRYH